MRRPYVLLSAAVSLDGALDDRSARRRVLSGPEDLDAVDALRAGCDAILVGAGTVRADDPRLLVRSERRRAERVARGLPPTPLRVVLTRTGDLDPAAALFRTGPPPLVYGPAPHLATAHDPDDPDRPAHRLAAADRDPDDRLPRAYGLTATGSDPPGAPLPTCGPGAAGGRPGRAVVLAGRKLPAVLEDLAGRGVGRLLVEGGSAVLAAMLVPGLADELRLAVAPELVGDPAAPRLLGPARAARLLDAATLGPTAVLRYAL